MRQLVLASTSPRRADLLRALEVEFTAVDPGLGDAAEQALVVEALQAGVSPSGVVRRVALAKLLAACARGHSGPLLACDTVVADGPRLLGKPQDEAAARAMLESLRGRVHDVWSGVAYVDARGSLTLDAERSRVRFRAFAPERLDAFLASGQWRGKAGAYGVQDEEAGFLWEAVEGSVSNVKGLPVERVAPLVTAGRG
ncbi:MAG: Maf family protein [Planctomycetes bacterium]|nr:Maf family protein [Planctomycetota bacterium]